MGDGLKRKGKGREGKGTYVHAYMLIYLPIYLSPNHPMPIHQTNRKLPIPVSYSLFLFFPFSFPISICPTGVTTDTNDDDDDDDDDDDGGNNSVER